MTVSTFKLHIMYKDCWCRRFLLFQKQMPWVLDSELQIFCSGTQHMICFPSQARCALLPIAFPTPWCYINRTWRTIVDCNSAHKQQFYRELISFLQVVALDVMLPVKQAFHALYEQVCRFGQEILTLFETSMSATFVTDFLFKWIFDNRLHTSKSVRIDLGCTFPVKLFSWTLILLEVSLTFNLEAL